MITFKCVDCGKKTTHTQQCGHLEGKGNEN